jgi:alpha-beta hydrolase superfamily lysophospholipase
MAQRYESRFENENGHELFYQSWIQPQASKTIVLTHGMAEHSDCYHEFATKMADDGFNTYAWDLFGHGRSTGKRGYVEKFDDYVRDLGLFINVVSEQLPDQNKQLILFGHSMGGLITLLHSLQSPVESINGIVLSSPALGYNIDVSAFKDWLARTSHKWFPSLTLYNEISYTDLTHDPEKIAEFAKDSLRHDKVCASIYLGMMEGFDFVRTHAHEIATPIFFQLAGQDHIVSSPRAKEVFEKISAENKLLEIYADSYHEIFNDIEKEHCFKDLKNFLRTLK